MAISRKEIIKRRTELRRKRKEKEEIYESLPKIDCGVCGAPTCKTFAEDVVRGDAELADCIFNLPQKYTELSQKLSELFNKPAFLSHIKPGAKKTSKKGKGIK